MLRAWAGLGYNRRALNLQRAARLIVARHGGELPRGLADLEALPGVGAYTAHAVAAIAFNRPVAAVDTNVRRVVGRVIAGHGTSADPGVALAPRELQQRADALVDPLHAAQWTHAMMDLASLVCRPVRPACPECPLAPGCVYRARALGGVGLGPSHIRERVDGQRPRGTGTPFPGTQRWLRGRLVEMLRGVPPGSWARIDAPLGSHDAQAVDKALASLSREGIIERDSGGRVRLPV